ncbi:FK506-binding protein 15 isoform X1 [Leptopilina heterotoma]|uniref:FK506-binding protein 15 isoform X1 n=1 Tax=Leptopilina heterotoma TaxID=63436 RepID=UPI001CA8F22B|nr:FK506-binding protein 15 isoform X1 [Leptopilina heterotoma]
MSGKNQLPDLDKIFREEDDDGFLPSGSSRLASIFGMNTNNVNTQPQIFPTKQKNVTQESKTEVVIAKAVHAYKLQNGNYTSIGKLGLALVGNVSTKSYQLILYRSKQEHISIVSINPDFSYIVQANNYSTYYDNRKENWSILFETSKECIEFAREIGVSRYLSRREKTNNSLIYQDLNAVNEKGEKAKEGDEISLKYIITTEIIQPLKNNSTAELSMTVEISTDDNWERILLGTMKNLRRMLILPPSKQISLGPGFPKERDIVLEIEIINIQRAKEMKIPEAESLISSSKASIISRMAKMGQSILPKTSISTTTDSDDTEDEIKKERTIRHRKGELPETSPSKKQFQSSHEITETGNLHKVIKSKVTSSVPNVQSSLYPVVYTPQWSPTQVQSQYMTVDGQTFPMAQQFVTQTMPGTLDPSLNIFLTESRTQNAEIRMGMSKISDNIQRLLDKFHVLELQNASSPSNDKTMENTLKMILSLNSPETKSNSIFTSGKLEESNKSQMNQLQETILTKEEELKTIREIANNANQEITKLKEEKRSLDQVNLELKEKILSLETNLATKKQEFDNLNTLHEAARENLNDCQKRNSNLEREILQLQSNCKSLEIAASTNQIKSTSKSDKNKEVKLIMNNTYHTLLSKFIEDNYSTSFIKETIANTLRDITLKVLNSDECEEESSDKKKMQEKNSQLQETERLSSSSLKEDNEDTKNDFKLNSETNLNNFIQIAPEFENVPPPIPPLDSSNEADLSDF